MRTGLVMLCALGCTVGAGDAHAEAGRYGWYFSGASGLALSSGMDQTGWNRDTVCYPTDPCFTADPAPELSGYRWGYDIDADAGHGFEFALGRGLGGLRLEVSFSRSRNDIGQEFASLEYFDGSPWIGREGTVVSNDVASIGWLTTRILALNVYRDFRVTRRLTPYAGAGLGAAFATVSDVQYSNDYQDTAESPPVYDPPLSFYNSVQDSDYSGRAAAGRLHAGVDYEVNDGMLLGVKLTWSLVGEITDTGVYASHPMQQEGDPPFTNTTSFGASQGWSLALAVKHRLGG
ncbi:MAG: hypothetical protein OXH50_03675 [Gemmatimonadetes bacterium]|nr:hypothetical protein [Gemmatimonadota bacterium]